MRMIFYAEPLNLPACSTLKKHSNDHSKEARWLSIEELQAMCADPTTEDKLRGKELIHWANYLEKGG